MNVNRINKRKLKKKKKKLKKYMKRQKIYGKEKSLIEFKKRTKKKFVLRSTKIIFKKNEQ